MTYQRSKTLVGDEKSEECLIAVDLTQRKIVLNKPMDVGFTVLELLKELMYRFHYEYILPKHGADNAHLLFTDTNSLTYHITTPDIYADMKQDIELFNTSDYPKEHPLHSNVNKKVIGKFKNENAGAPVSDL